MCNENWKLTEKRKKYTNIKINTLTQNIKTRAPRALRIFIYSIPIRFVELNKWARAANRKIPNIITNTTID